MKAQGANLQTYEKNLYHISSFMYFAFILEERISISSSKESLKVCKQNFF